MTAASTIRRFTTRKGRTLDFTTLGFGSAPLGNFLRAFTEEECDETMRAAWDAGLRYYDTAPLYGLGLSEQRVGRILKQHPRDSYLLSTKVGRVLEPLAPGETFDAGIYVDLPPLKYVYDYSYDGVMRSFESSLERLGLERVDILFVHDVDGPNHGGRAGSEARIQELMTTGGWRAVDELRSAGVVDAIGIGVNEAEPCARMLELADPDLFLLAGRYTLLEQAPLDTLFPQCEAKGAKIVLGGPYNSGVLAGKTTFNYGEIPQEIATRVKALRAVCDAHGVKLRDAALAFVAAHPIVVSVIPGAISPREVADNVAILEEKIPAALWDELRAKGLLHPKAPVPKGDGLMRVDAHHHFWRLDRKDYDWLTAEAFPAIYHDFLPPDIAPHLKACGIDKTVLVQGAETVAETEFLLDIAKATPFIGGVVGWVDFAAKDAPDTIAWLAQNKTLKSLRPMLQGLPEDDWILRPELTPALKALGPNGLRFDVLVFPRHLPHAAKFFRQYPDLPMVIDHGAKPYIAKGEIEPWKSEMTAIARDFPNVCCKLSGLATEAAPGWTSDTLKPYVDALIAIWGPKRLMWGSDWPVLNVAGNYRDWFAIAQKLTAHLSEGDRADIFGNTAQKFYGIA